MFFKLIFLFIILFLFIIKKNNIEPFIDCIQKYYNHHVKIFMKDNINEYGVNESSQFNERITKNK